MSAALLAAARPTQPTVTARLDPAGLWHAVDRVAGAAFCTDLDPTIVSFALDRITEHFGVPENVVDAMVAIQLLSLTVRLGRELQHITAL